MKTSTPMRLLSAFILVLNIIITSVFILSILFTYRLSKGIDKSRETIAELRSQLAETQGNWDYLIKDRLEKYEYIKNWHDQDRKDFEYLFNNRVALKDEIYKEYVALNIKLNELDKKAYHDPKGYILYSPLLTEAHNALNLAINARARVLTDTPYDNAEDKGKWESYYCEREDYYKYLYHTDELISPNEYSIDYDQEKFIKAINELPLPDNYFDRLRLFFVDKDSPTAEAVNLIDYHGNDDIVIFNDNLGIDDKIGVVIHEIGHVVGREILYKYKEDNEDDVIKQEDETAMLEYARIYGRNVYYTHFNINNHDEWAGSLGENFAEDFASIYAKDYSKKSNWGGNHKDEVKAFIENKIKQLNDAEPAQFKGAKILFRNGNSEFESALRTDELNIFYTKNNRAMIQFENLNKNGRNLEVFMGLSHQDSLFKEAQINSKNQLDIYFPSKGKYVVIVVSDDPNSSLNVTHYRLVITYDP